MRIIGLITSLLYPLTFPLLKTGHKLYFFKSNFKQNLGNLAPYRKIKRKTVPKNIKYEIVTKEELLSLAMFIKSDVKRVKEFIKMGNIYFQAKISKHSIAVVVVSKFWKDICPDQYWIMGLYVEPEHRLKGVAENLIKKTISELKNKKFKKVYITVFETNTPALNLYKKIGFKPVYNQEITDKIDKYYKETDANSPKSLIFRLKL